MSIGFVFPGQGSQTVGMLADLAEQETCVAEAFQEANDALGFDLRNTMLNGPEDELNQTSITQPAILTASVALWRLWCERSGAMPVAVAGHSLGEYSALVAADALSFADAVVLVNQRGLLMQAAVPVGQGLMAAILGLDDELVEAACADIDGASPANYNAPGQVVLAGSREAVEKAIAACSEAGARRATALAMSVPSHCALMMPAAEQLAERLANTAIGTPRVPLHRNIDGQVSADADSIRDALRQQLFSPVRWTTCVQQMAASGVTQMVECGPSKVLSGLAKRIDRSVEMFQLDSPDAFEATASALS